MSEHRRSVDHHRSHRPVVSDGQLEIIGSDGYRSADQRLNSLNSETVSPQRTGREDTNHLAGFAAIKEARRILEEATAHEAERDRERSNALRKLPPPFRYRNAS